MLRDRLRIIQGVYHAVRSARSAAGSQFVVGLWQLKAVPHIANRTNIPWPAGIGLDLAAERVDATINAVGCHEDTVPPHGIENLITRYCASCAPEKVSQRVEFLGGQRDLLAVTDQPVRIEVVE